jgi:hypothetical protein
MKQISEEACRVANRVSLSMVFAESSGLSDPSGSMIREGFSATCQLLDRVDPVVLRTWYSQFEVVFDKTRILLTEDASVWSAFLGAQCDELHRLKLHQGMIASLGNEMAVWDRIPVSFNKLADSLDHLIELVTQRSEELRTAIDREAGFDAQRKRRSQLFSHAVAGLAIVLSSIDRAITKGDPRDQDCAGLATFGASLVVNCVSKLLGVCNTA